MTILEASHLYKSFGDIHVLKDVSLTMERGQVVAVIGPSGSGKSTLLRCINCLERVEKGVISISGTPLCSEQNGKSVYLKDDELRLARLKLGMVFQNFNLFPHLTVLENITLAPIHVEGTEKDVAIATAKWLLNKVGLLEKANAYPCELSGGQSQRVAIARALAIGPDILCFDEPTSALDPELTGEVLTVIKELAAEHMTMLIVTHEMGFAKEVANEVVFMDDGKIIDRGTPDDLIVNPKEDRIKQFLNKLISV